MSFSLYFSTSSLRLVPNFSFVLLLELRHGTRESLQKISRSHSEMLDASKSRSFVPTTYTLAMNYWNRPVLTRGCLVPGSMDRTTMLAAAVLVVESSMTLLLTPVRLVPSASITAIAITAAAAAACRLTDASHSSHGQLRWCANCEHYHPIPCRFSIKWSANRSSSATCNLEIVCHSAGSLHVCHVMQLGIGHTIWHTECGKKTGLAQFLPIYHKRLGI